jgi:hypothetical protein
MRHETASELADYLANHLLPIYGSISTAEAQRLLFHRGGLSTEQIMHAIAVAVCRQQVVREHGGATLRKTKP